MADDVKIVSVELGMRTFISDWISLQQVMIAAGSWGTNKN